LILLYPPLFSRLVKWALARRQGEGTLVSVDFKGHSILLWLLLQGIAVVTGGGALFVLLASMMVVPSSVLGQLITAWAAAVAVGNLFFWLPATFLLRDGALVVAVSGSITLPIAVLFAAMTRVWMIASTLLLAGLVWIIFDYRPARPRPSTTNHHPEGQSLG
jgi:hypothetical protein